MEEFEHCYYINGNSPKNALCKRSIKHYSSDSSIDSFYGMHGDDEKDHRYNF